MAAIAFGEYKTVSGFVTVSVHPKTLEETNDTV